MTQVDLPQISVQRYVELLKRRRWQVIPVSLLGLVVGGIVAFFIPRYFVASATLVYRQPPGETAGPADEDPFEAIVDSARLTLPDAIGPTIKSLGWAEGLVADPFELSENIAAIKDRLVLSEENAGNKRTFARIRVTYKDRDGMRASQFTNTLVATWVEQRIEEQRAAAKAKLATATEQHRQQYTAFDKFLREKQSLEVEYQIEPSLDPQWQRSQSERRTARALEIAGKLTTGRSEVGRLEVVLGQLRTQLEATTQRLAPEPALLEAQAATNPEAKQLVVFIKLSTLSMAAFHQGRTERIRHEKFIAKAKAELAEILAALPGGIAVGEDGLILNPAYKALAEQVATLERTLEEQRAALLPLQAEADAEAARVARLPEGFARYARVLQQYDETLKKLAAADTVVEDATQILGKLDNTPTVSIDSRASPPPRPTEPNIVLVALLGCIVGLLVATALILLLDILQGSFKTIDDVERSLPVPVLGGMSHLQTVEESQALRKGRRRVTLVAAAFVFLVTGVVLVFYYDPTRLPPFVRDLLALVLGA